MCLCYAQSLLQWVDLMPLPPGTDTHKARRGFRWAQGKMQLQVHHAPAPGWVPKDLS